VLVDCVLYSDGKREPVGMAEAVRKARSVPGSFVWLGLHEPTYDEFDDLALYFAPHPLAIEDAVNAHQRPKLDAMKERGLAPRGPPGRCSGCSRPTRRRRPL
jgi:magnesium transporter